MNADLLKKIDQEAAERLILIEKLQDALASRGASNPNALEVVREKSWRVPAIGDRVRIISNVVAYHCLVVGSEASVQFLTTICAAGTSTSGFGVSLRSENGASWSVALAEVEPI